MSTQDATVRQLHTAFDEFYKDKTTRAEDTTKLLFKYQASSLLFLERKMQTFDEYGVGLFSSLIHI